MGINADNSWDNITYMHNAYETVRIHVALLPRTCSNLPNACKYTEWSFVWRENGLWTDRLCLTFLQICPNLHQEGADGMQPPSSRVLGASLFYIYQVGVVTDTHRNIEVSWKEGR